MSCFVRQIISSLVDSAGFLFLVIAMEISLIEVSGWAFL